MNDRLYEDDFETCEDDTAEGAVVPGSDEAKEYCSTVGGVVRLLGLVLMSSLLMGLGKAGLTLILRAAFGAKELQAEVEARREAEEQFKREIENAVAEGTLGVSFYRLYFGNEGLEEYERKIVRLQQERRDAEQNPERVQRCE